jgi:hypothetical protein
MSTATVNVGTYLEAVRTGIVDAGLPCGIAVKPETTTGQPWAILSVLGVTFDGDIYAYNTDHDTLVFVRSVGTSSQQAHAAYWRADAALMAVGTFPGGVVTFRTRETLSGPLRDDSTFPDRSVYYVDATYRLWLAPIEETD